MRDYANSPHQRNKVAANKIKVQRKPLDFTKLKRPLRMVFGGMFALTLLVGVFSVGSKAFGSAMFCTLKTIKVSDTKRISRDEILAMAAVAPGQNLFSLNLKKVGDQLTRNPWVEAVRVHRYYPDMLSIAVTEREPLAIVSMGLIYYLDKKGTVFKTLNQGDKLDYPVVTGFSEEESVRDPAGTREALKSTCELLEVLRKQGAFILADVSEIHYDKGYGFTLFTASGALPVKIGSSDFSSKLERLSRIYPTVMASRATLQYIDLDYNDKIVVKKS